MALYPLGTVVEIIESIGAVDGNNPALSVSHVHEDLVFLEHNAFMLQFTSKPTEVLIHVNQEANSTEIENYIAALKKEAMNHRMIFSDGQIYRLKQADDENISIEFIPVEAA